MEPEFGFARKPNSLCCLISKDLHCYDGYVVGFCVMQNGPLPKILSEVQVTRLIGNEMQLTKSEQQFRKGLNVFRLVDVSSPELCFFCLLMRNISV